MNKGTTFEFEIQIVNREDGTGEALARNGESEPQYLAIFGQTWFDKERFKTPHQEALMSRGHRPGEDPGASVDVSITVEPEVEEELPAAIEDLEPGDALLIAGKGHETGQIIGDRVLPFSDHEAVAAALASRVA